MLVKAPFKPFEVFGGIPVVGRYIFVFSSGRVFGVLIMEQSCLAALIAKTYARGIRTYFRHISIYNDFVSACPWACGKRLMGPRGQAETCLKCFYIPGILVWKVHEFMEKGSGPQGPGGNMFETNLTHTEFDCMGVHTFVQWLRDPTNGWKCFQMTSHTKV